jgi:hypothetical protein
MSVGAHLMPCTHCTRTFRILYKSRKPPACIRTSGLWIGHERSTWKLRPFMLSATWRTCGMLTVDLPPNRNMFNLLSTTRRKSPFCRQKTGRHAEVTVDLYNIKCRRFRRGHQTWTMWWTRFVTWVCINLNGVYFTSEVDIFAYIFIYIYTYSSLTSFHGIGSNF